MKAEKYAPADLNNGFVVAIEIVAKAGEEDAVAHGLEILIGPTMAEPVPSCSRPRYRSPTNCRAFFIFELYLNEQGRRRPTTHRPSRRLWSTGYCHALQKRERGPMFLTPLHTSPFPPHPTEIIIYRNCRDLVRNRCFVCGISCVLHPTPVGEFIWKF